MFVMIEQRQETEDAGERGDNYSRRVLEKVKRERIQHVPGGPPADTPCTVTGKAESMGTFTEDLV